MIQAFHLHRLDDVEMDKEAAAQVALQQHFRLPWVLDGIRTDNVLGVDPGTQLDDNALDALAIRLIRNATSAAKPGLATALNELRTLSVRFFGMRVQTGVALTCGLLRSIMRTTL